MNACLIHVDRFFNIIAMLDFSIVVFKDFYKNEKLRIFVFCLQRYEGLSLLYREQGFKCPGTGVVSEACRHDTLQCIPCCADACRSQKIHVCQHIMA